MSRLFISHSSANNAEAAALNLWLREQGWDDIFLDVTADRGIAAGERWERALNEAASRCEAVLFLVSRDWIGSRWCRKEFDLARRLNKRLFGALIETIPVAELPSEVTDTFQMVDLASGQDHLMIRTEIPRTHEEVHVTFSKEGLFRLKSGLAKAGLDPRFFPWPPTHDPARSPYRGLLAMEAEDAGIFFGRDAPIVEGLDMLRGLAEAAAPRLLVILGASGAGKSSFLRAGLLPRLARDDRTFLTLPVIRPEGGAISGEAGLVPAIEGALRAQGIPQSRAGIRAAIEGGGPTLKPLLARLSAQAFTTVLTEDGGSAPPIVTLAIDQAEELFHPGSEGEALLALVRDLVATDDPAVIVLFTIRSNSYDSLESAKPLEGLRQRTLPLLPMPRGAYQTVIEGPAARLAETKRPLAIEPRLTQRLLEEIETGAGSDALPLLAFTLGQLHLDFGGEGALRLQDYETFGGIRGAIEAAVRRAMIAADRDGRLPRDPEARLALLRRGLIPWLAGVDPETASPRRRLARLSDIPEEAAPLVNLLVEQRLLSVDRARMSDRGRDRTEVTIEPAHEALLRQWGLLRGWLHEDFAALTVLDAAKRAARDWEANARAADWLNHTGTRLAEAETVAGRADLAADLGAAARDYLAACRDRDDAEERERAARIEGERRLAETQLRFAEAEAESAAAMAKAAGERARAARRLTWITATAALVVLALVVTAGGLYALVQTRERQAAVEEAANLWAFRSDSELRSGNAVAAVESARRAVGVVSREQTRSALLSALAAIPNLAGTLSLPDGPAQALLWLDDGTVGLASQAAALRTVSTARPSSPAGAGWLSPEIADVRAGHAFVRAMRLVGPDRIVMALSDGSILGLARGSRDVVISRPAADTTVVDAAAIGRTGRVVVTAANGEGVTVATCPAAGGSCRSRQISNANVRSVALDETEERVAIGDESGAVFVFDLAGNALGQSAPAGSPVTALAWSPDGASLAEGDGRGYATVRDPTTFKATTSGQFSKKPIGHLAFSPDGRRLALSCGLAAACTWNMEQVGPGAASGTVDTYLKGGGAEAVALGWSPDGVRLATAFADGLVRVWDAAPSGVPGAPLRPEIREEAARIALAPDGALLAGGLRDGSVQLWDLGARDAGRRLPAPVRNEQVASVAWARDGRLAAVLGDGSIAIWTAGSATPRLLRWEANANPGLAWADGDRLLAVALSDGRIATHDPATDKTGFLLPIGPGSDAWGLAASPDGRHLFATYVKGQIVRWEVATGRSTVLRDGTGTAAGDKGGPASLSPSPDGRWLAVTAEDDLVRLFDTAGGGRRELKGRSDRTRTVAFSPDGRRLATLGEDGIVAVWTVAGDAVTSELAVSLQADIGGGIAAVWPSWLAWLGPDTLALSHRDGSVRTIGLDEAAWRARADSLALRLDPPR